MIKVRRIEQHGERLVRVEYNDVIEEYRCRLFVNGTLIPQADYFTPNLKDAIGTARLMARAAEACVRVEPRPEVQYLVVFGDPVGGLRFVGPFADRDDAVTYAEFDARPEDWWVAELRAPDTETEDPTNQE